MNIINNIDRTVLESINFETPTKVDADKLQTILWQANARPTYTGFSNASNGKLFVFDWRVIVSGNTLVLAYSYQRTRPFKKKVTSNTYIIEFLSADRFLACRPGGHLIYEYEDSPIWEQAINPIMQALEFEYNRDGECIRPGTKSGWRD